MRSTFLTLLLALSPLALESKENIGLVNFRTCIIDSALGKKESAKLQETRQKTTLSLQETEKELNAVLTKLNDQDYLDALSKEGQEELKTKFQMLNEEMNRSQNQSIQMLQEGQRAMVQKVFEAVQSASKKVSQEKKIPLILNEEAAFYSDASLNVTALVIKEMDKRDAEEMAKLAKQEQQKHENEAKASEKKTSHP